MERHTVTHDRFPPKRGRLRARAVVALIATALLSACQSVIEQSYEPTVSPSSNPQIVDEVQKNDPRAKMGAREHPRIVASYGGEYKDAKTERLVARIAGALTAVSENPQQSYRITILNSPAINAFALPGGYLYVTRGLLALANDASEVAAVLSHEMAHVTANHGIERQQREEAEVIASRVVSEVLSSDLAGKQALARGKLRLAAFSRNQELQADVIGVRMLGEAGYDPYAAARFLDSMAAYSRFTAVDPESDQSLDFLSSHPNAPQRVDLARRHARAFGPEGTSGDRGRDYYLAGIDGLLYGDSPQEGYVRGQTFLHGQLGIRFDVPTGFQIDNKAEAVLATGPGDIAVRFDGVADTGGRSLTDYIASGWVTGLQPDTIRPININGLEAATARASADRWDFDVTVIRIDTRIYRFLTAVPKGSNALEPTANQLRSSFRRMTQGEAQSLKPLRIRVVTVRPGETIATLSARMMGTDRKLDLFRVINAMQVTSTVKPGDKVKIVSE
ncbi:M48 family metalloprotease [Ensifer sp. ENS10]|jgi:predicted Zn-dependent protease|uniref:M48 family metalloprotease n=1 Tax=Sinorhizobium/Ensifer group TaxID=227292 RepID=UPI000710187D|nr:MULTISPECIES: M48 family metalloprotease [Sinorhizobium/Ensifer group]KRD49951.1 metalloprotease [Ensifer sp. Root278]KSV84773.1 metalloprotease [Sinorhizobium sp. Sb3]MBD9509386.1 M48 family metalloprotease [Ensifer sp. ENS10]MBV7519842.1 M48 family metalloprotease [Ensifer sp. ENS12]SDA68003.1 Putative Zn-dependent protease [Sinorhizobium sp. NFACC03]